MNYKWGFEGIRSTALNWIQSYLTKRKQYVSFNNTCSDKQFIRCGILQESILGPLLFVLYINDFPRGTNLEESLLFADDTSIFYSSTCLQNAVSVMNNELADVDLYMKANRVSVR